MKRKSNIAQLGLLTLRCLLVCGILLMTGCVKNEFVEPPDPFENERLEEGYQMFEFGSGNARITVLTNSDNVTVTEKGNTRIRGTLFTQRPDMPPIKVAQGDFILLKNLSPGQKSVDLGSYQNLPISREHYRWIKSGGGSVTYEGFGGYSEFTLPKAGVMYGVEVPETTGSPTGFALGSELEDFPVNPDRYYFYYYYPEPATMLMGQSANLVDRMAMDPEDPYFYMHASMSIPGLDVIEDGGFAVSVQGMIPFEVPSYLSFGKVESFNYGNIMVQASINLEKVLKVPFVIKDATCTLGFGNLEDGNNFFNGLRVPMMMGLKGDFVINIEDIVEWPLGGAAMSLRIGGEDYFKASFAGYYNNKLNIPQAIGELTGLDTDGEAWKFIQLPQQVTEITGWGTISSNPKDWEIGLKSQSYFDFPGIKKIDMGGVEFEINPQHIYFDGSLPLAMFGTVGLLGEIRFNGGFRFKGYAEADYGFEKWGLSISVGYHAHFDLNVEAYDDWYFEVAGKVYLDVSLDLENAPNEMLMAYDVYQPEPHTKMSASFSAKLNSDGKFEGYVKFEFLGVGYKFKFSFSLKSSNEAVLEPGFDLEEIPLSEVPPENFLTLKNLPQ